MKSTVFYKLTVTQAKRHGHSRVSRKSEKPQVSSVLLPKILGHTIHIFAIISAPSLALLIPAPFCHELFCVKPEFRTLHFSYPWRKLDRAEKTQTPIPSKEPTRSSEVIALSSTQCLICSIFRLKIVPFLFIRGERGKCLRICLCRLQRSDFVVVFQLETVC